MFLIQLQTFPDILFAGSLVNTNRCSSSLKRSYKHIASNSHPWYLALCVKDCRRAFTVIPISGFWWRILGKLHHRCLTQVPANFMSTVTKIKDQSSVSQTMQQNINSTPLSAATWETRRTLILGWNASPQGFRGLTKRTRQRWDLLKQNDQIDLTKEEFKGLHWHRRDGEWYAGRDLWAVQVSIFNWCWHSQFKVFFLQGQIATSPGST